MNALRYIVLFLVLLLPSVNAKAGWYYNNICFPDDVSLIEAFKASLPTYSGGVLANIQSALFFTSPYPHIAAQIYTTDVTTTISSSNALTFGVTFCDTPTNVVPAVTVGADSNSCFTKGSCNNNDVVNALTVTQDVLIYAAACLIFFFGFHVGMGLMLGAVRRQET